MDNPVLNNIFRKKQLSVVKDTSLHGGLKKTLGVYTVREGNISSRNYFKRLKNIIHVKIRHRSKGGLLFLTVVFKTFLYYLAKPLIPFFKKIFKLKN